MLCDDSQNFTQTRTKMASPDWPGNTDLKTRISLVHSLLIFLLKTQQGNESTAKERLLLCDWMKCKQVKRCMHYHDNGASNRIRLIQLKVNWFYSINLNKSVLFEDHGSYCKNSKKKYGLLSAWKCVIFVCHGRILFILSIIVFCVEFVCCNKLIATDVK